MISYVLPHRDRPASLARTLSALGSLRGHDAFGGAEVIVVDNASSSLPEVPAKLPNNLPVTLIPRAHNEGAASRNAGVQATNPASRWVVMLDDDSSPLDTGFIKRLFQAPPDVAAVSADIFLPGPGRRESGGLPEVFVGCGVAIRRDVFLDLGGYDPSFGYYVEEYDLAARMLLAGFRVQFDRWFRVEHHKVWLNRNMDTILERLVRNNGWVAQRYAPDSRRRDELCEVRSRYRRIAIKESALAGYARGLGDLRRTIHSQTRTPMPEAVFDRFTGLTHARHALAEARANSAFDTASVVDEGKNAWVVRQALRELGVRIVDREQDADVLVIGTMSPGPMLDAYERRLAASVFSGRRVIAPWRVLADAVAAPLRDVLTGGRPAAAASRPRDPAAEQPRSRIPA
jgi:GT2 family glycosyltransferase